MIVAPSAFTHSGTAFWRRAAVGLAVVGMFAAASTPGNATAGPPQATPGWVKGRVLVAPRAGLSDDEFQKILGAVGGRSVGKLPGLGVHVVELQNGVAEDAVANALAHNPHLKFAEPDRLVAPELSATDPYYGSEWHLQKIQAPLAWDTSLGSGVTVAILDTGVNSLHPELQGQTVPGWNFYDNNSDTSDVYGHGTLVAGVVAAQSNNGLGVTSVAWNAKLMPIRISDTTGYASWSAAASGLTWAADHGAKVANISYAVQGSSTVKTAAQYLRSKGGVVVAAAGNSGTYDSTAASDVLLSVAATDSSDNRASWSTYGPYVDLSAPGVGIWSTTSAGGYSAVSGTSVASPLTAGVAALMFAANPALGPADVVNLLESTAVDLGTAGYDQFYGFGRVNAAAAVQAAAQFQAKDTQAPTVAIASPAAGATVSGLVAVDVSAADNVGVTRVDLLVNGTVVASDMASPFQFSWDSIGLAASSATLTARASDAAGNTATSAGVSVAVVNSSSTSSAPSTPDTIAPTVQITNPRNGAKVSGQVSVSVSSADNVGVTKVMLYIDGNLVATGNTSSLSYKWNASKASPGSHSITATAQDAAGNRSTASESVAR